MPSSNFFPTVESSETANLAVCVSRMLYTIFLKVILTTFYSSCFISVLFLISLLKNLYKLYLSEIKILIFLAWTYIFVQYRIK